MAAFHLNHGTCRKPDYIHLAGNPLTGPKLARGVLQRWLGARYQPQVWRNRGCWGGWNVQGLAFVVGRPGRLGSVRFLRDLQLSRSETFTWIISWALAKFPNSLIPKDFLYLVKQLFVKMPIPLGASCVWMWPAFSRWNADSETWRNSRVFCRRIHGIEEVIRNSYEFLDFWGAEGFVVMLCLATKPAAGPQCQVWVTPTCSSKRGGHHICHIVV